MQKVVIINVNSKVDNDNNQSLNFAIQRCDELNKLIESEYKITSFHQISPPASVNSVTLTFILDKR